MKHQYVRRTFDEAQTLAQSAFKAIVSNHLTPTELQEMGESALFTGGTPGGDWKHEVGFLPTERTHYEMQLYKPSENKPYIEKSFVRMLVPRNRDDEVVLFKWRPHI